MSGSAELIQVPCKLFKQQTVGLLSVYESKLLWTPDNPTEATTIEIQTKAVTGRQQKQTVGQQVLIKDGREQKGNQF